MEKLIRLFIVDRNMRRDEFLKRAGLSNGYLTMVTKNDGLNPSLDILYRIADVFKIPASSFYEILEKGERYVIAEVENYSRPAFTQKDYALCLYYCIYCIAGTNQYKMAMKADCPLQVINNILISAKLNRKTRLSSIINLLKSIDIKLSEYLTYLESVIGDGKQSFSPAELICFSWAGKKKAKLFRISQPLHLLLIVR